MIRLSQAIAVEGRYDKIKLDTVVDGIVVTTDGFNIFKDEPKQALFKRLARECGLIVLTDSDEAGFRIRKFLSDITGGAVYHAYIPETAGKERRKAKPGAAGLVGVEGIDNDILKAALRRCAEENGLAGQAVLPAVPVTAADLYEDGLSGRQGARQRRAALLQKAGLPTRLSTNALLHILTRLYGYEGYKHLVAGLRNDMAE